MEAKIWNDSRWISKVNPNEIKEIFNNILVNSGFKILESVEHYFTPQGYTLMFLLAESHFACHTFPEESKSYIELSSCNELYYNKYVQFVENLRNI